MIKEISIKGNAKRIALCHSNDGSKIIYTVMEALSKRDENNIEELIKHKRHIYFKNVFGQIVDEQAILLYGDIDINDKKDRVEIEKLKLINQDYGNWVPTSFNYEKNTITEINGIVKTYTTFNSILNFKYCHSLIGKPKKIIIYNVIGTHKKLSNRQWT